MNDAVAEKLVQKVANMLDEMSDLNIQVRRLTPPQETLNRLNERIDAMHTAIMKIEKGLNLDERRVTALEEQSKSMMQTFDALKESMVRLAQKTDESRRDMVAGIEKKFDQWEDNFNVKFSALIGWTTFLAGVILVLLVIILWRR
jgi:predicted  nucleic acid-binding Zn-ribbon protein